MIDGDRMTNDELQRAIDSCLTALSQDNPLITQAQQRIEKHLDTLLTIQRNRASTEAKAND